MIPRDILSRIVEAGAWAPSGDNCQPWEFKWDGSNLLLFNVPERDTSIYNSGNRASYVAHGAAIENMNITARACGYRLNASLFPKGAKDSLIAGIKFQECPKEDDPLLPFITERHTNRNPYKKGRAISKDILHVLQSLSGDSPAELHLTGDRNAKKLLGKAVAVNDRILFEHKELHHFLFSHIRWSEEEIRKTKDGMPIRSMGLNSFQIPAFKLLGKWGVVSFLNSFGLSRMIPFQSYGLCVNSSAMGLIQMPGTTPEDFVLGGRLLQKVWLTTAKYGLAFHPMTGVTFLIQHLQLDGGKEFSQSHKALLKKAWSYLEQVFPVAESKGIIMLFRIGYAPPPSVRAPRGAIEDILDAGQDRA